MPHFNDHCSAGRLGVHLFLAGSWTARAISETLSSKQNKIKNKQTNKKESIREEQKSPPKALTKPLEAGTKPSVGTGRLFKESYLAA